MMKISNCLSAVAVIILVSLSAQGGHRADSMPMGTRPAIGYLSEMASLGIDVKPVGRDCENAVIPQARWELLRPWLLSKIEGDEVREISRWAHQEMENYETPTDWHGAGLVFFGCSEERVVFETTLDILPSHHPLVVRKLKAYIVTQREAALVQSRIIVTIRGTLEE